MSGIKLNFKIVDMEKAFAIFDVNKDGRITKDELQMVFKEANLVVSDKQLDEFISRLDSDGNGSIDYGEFCAIMKDVVVGGAEARRLQKLKSHFDAIDLNGDGRIDANELKIVLEKLTGDTIEEEDTAAIILAVDRDGDGDINFDEFCTMVHILKLY